MITIIGGGAFGLAIGWYLARAGKDVTLVEQSKAGHGATWAAAGMVMPWRLTASFNGDLFALQRASYQQWPQFADDLTQQAHHEIDYCTTGRYFIGMHPKGLERLKWQYQFHTELGYPLEWLSEKALRRRETQFGPTIQAAVFTTMAQQVDNRQLALALQKAFISAGGQLREDTPVLEVMTAKGAIQAVRLPQEVLPCEQILITTGAWSSLLAGIPPSLQDKVKPLKGQSIIAEMSADKLWLTHQIVGPAYFVPRQDGRLLIGTTFDPWDEFDTRPTVGGIGRILNKAMEIIPKVKSLPIIEMGSGVRPTTAERVPILGATEIEGLFVATGGHSHGILLSPIVAETISQLLLTGEVSPLIKPFEPRHEELP